MLPAMHSRLDLALTECTLARQITSQRVLAQASHHHLQLKTNIRVFAQPETPERPSSTREDSLFFAQEMMDQRGSKQNGDSEYIYFSSTQQSQMKKSSSSGGMDAYAAQFSAMTSQQRDPTDGAEFETTPLYEDVSSPEIHLTETKTDTAENTQRTPESTPQAISNLDARVLESILQEGKLDLKTEEQVKKLLEGPRAIDDDRDTTAPVKGEYNSKFVSKISDNTFWNSLKAKAGEIVETVQIYIENRVERDTKALAAVGLFALDRIQRDVSRALPAAGRQVKKLLLASNSTYAEKILSVTEKTIFALPSERSITNRDMDSYEDMATPADEIKQVTEAIRDILSGKELPSSTSRRRVVRSLAPAGTSRTAERQQRAYQARKKTVLQREKEGIDRTLGRAIGSVSDTTWELRQEMNSGIGREAGYRSKGVRKALAAGAVRLLEAGKEGGTRLLTGGGDKMLSGDAGTKSTFKNAVVDVVDVDAMEEEDMIDEMIDETNLEYAPDGLLSPRSFIEEKRRLIASLESCLSQPGQTWLTKDVVSQATESGISLDGEVLREVITSMVTLRDELKEEIKEEDNGDRAYLKIDYVQKELRRMKEMVDVVTSLAAVAAGEGAAMLLKTELEGFVLSDSLDEIVEIELERLEQLLAEIVATRKREINNSRRMADFADVSERFVYPASSVEVVEQERDQKRLTPRKNELNDIVFTEVEVEPRASYDQPTSVQDVDGSVDIDQDYYEVSGSTVELISDEEYSDYEQRFKTVQSSDWVVDDDGEDKEGDNPVGKFVLRVIDAIFFVGEKFFLVGLPAIMTTGSNISFRYFQAQNRGNGSVGWQQLKNLKRKKNQY
ncbi:LOW QUALITY PROTEIN: hypothetical protein HJC23_005405 [Cyclotella cryptica]|uniref:Uncharacterized protein n=1 Tax=Cyclotella cryptica TaxID=29204 RepID=A0ABD3P0V9_9STRA